MDRKYNLVGSSDTMSAAGKIAPYFNEDSLISASNKGTYKRALKDLDACTEIQISVDDTGISACMAGETVHLEGDISKCTCTCPSKIICRHIIAAAAAVGELSDAPEQAAEVNSDTTADVSENAQSDKTAEAVEIDRPYAEEILHTAENLLAKGIMSCTENDSEILTRLALKGGTLYKNTSGLCRSCAAEITLMNSRSAEFSQISAAYLFCRLYNTAAALLGKNGHKLIERAGFSHEGRGSFMCLGAYPVISRSGYASVTAALYEREIKQFFTCSVMLPTFYSSTENVGKLSSLNKLFHTRSHWQSERSIASLIGLNFILVNYKSDERGRISSSKQTSCASGKPVTTDDIPDEILSLPKPEHYDYFSSRRNEQFFAVVKPKITDVEFNSSIQTLVFTVSGKNIDEIECALPYVEYNKNAIEFIEHNSKKSLGKCFMLMRKYGESYYPISIINGDTVRNIYF